jgi:hypothetical protein
MWKFVSFICDVKRIYEQVKMLLRFICRLFLEWLGYVCFPVLYTTQIGPIAISLVTVL